MKGNGWVGVFSMVKWWWRERIAKYRSGRARAVRVRAKILVFGFVVRRGVVVSKGSIT